MPVKILDNDGVETWRKAATKLKVSLNSTKEEASSESLEQEEEKQMRVWLTAEGK